MAGRASGRGLILEIAKKVLREMGIMIKGYLCTALSGIAGKLWMPLRQTRKLYDVASLATLVIHSHQFEVSTMMF